MKNTLLKSIFIVVVGVLSFFSCKKSDDMASISAKIEINDDSVLNADVNAPDYWANSTMVWNDEFNGSTLDMSKWLFETYEPGQGDTELQTYVINDNVEVSRGTLKIFAEQNGNGQNRGDYTSVRLNCKYAFTYGRMEVRAKLPFEKGNGLWAKLWMLGTNIQTIGYPKCGEIDMMEYVSHIPNKVYTTVHTSANSGINGIPDTSGPFELESVEEVFHNYGVLWTDRYLKFYVDDISNIVYTFARPSEANDNNWPFDKSFYFLMNIVVGGEFGGVEGVDNSVFPTFMEIDYVRVFHAK